MTNVTEALHALRDYLIANPNQTTNIDTDFGEISELLHTAMTFNSVDHNDVDYLRQMGFFSYALVETARTQSEQTLLNTYCANLLQHVVLFHLSENMIFFEDADV